MLMIVITPALGLDENEIHFDFIRASGPGGQNVNKVATSVQLRFDAAHSPSLPDDVRTRLLHLSGSRLTADGLLVIDAHRFRTQEQNRQDAIQRLVALVRQAAIPPLPRRRTRPTAASKERRLESKRRHSTIKKMRRSDD
jgi:ribosome-associated protein